MNEILYVTAMEYYLAIQRNEALTQATTWMNPENMMLSEKSQSQKEKKNMYYMIPFMWTVQNKQI